MTSSGFLIIQEFYRLANANNLFLGIVMFVLSICIGRIIEFTNSEWKNKILEYESDIIKEILEKKLKDKLYDKLRKNQKMLKKYKLKIKNDSYNLVNINEYNNIKQNIKETKNFLKEIKNESKEK